ncbi:MAG: hypothetical protein ABEJ56_00635 [Candidatus Nanohaloarchaea archaeon]
MSVETVPYARHLSERYSRDETYTDELVSQVEDLCLGMVETLERQIDDRDWESVAAVVETLEDQYHIDLLPLDRSTTSTSQGDMDSVREEKLDDENEYDIQEGVQG